MNDVLDLKKLDLVALTRPEQTTSNGGEIPFAVLVGMANPVVGLYCGALAIAYYAGYGAHVAYDVIKN